MSEQPHQPPVVEVVSGSPTPEELAAIITVVTAAGGSAPAEDTRADRPRVGGWKSYTRTLRKGAFPGPGAWRHLDR